MAPANRTYLPDVFHGHRLTAAGIVGDCQHHQRNAFAAHSRDQSLERWDIHIAFEGVNQAGLFAFGNHQVDRFGADEFDVGAGGIEMSVVGDDVAFLAHHAEQDALGGPALMGGNYMSETEDVLDRLLEAIETLAAGVAFVALHDRGPLVGGHGAGTGIGEEVDENIGGGK